jgi:ribonuclease P/MRP protein subunit RPP1
VTHRCGGWHWRPENLGFDGLVAAATASGEFAGIEVCSGILIERTATKDIINRVRREKNTKTVLSVQAGDNAFNRAMISLKGVHIIRGIQLADKTAFDHVAAKMAADNQVAIDIDLSPLVSGRGISRQRAIHRYRDVLVLERRFEFPITISSHARSILEMRAVREIAGLCTLLDMEISDIEMALSGVDTITRLPVPAVMVV